MKEKILFSQTEIRKSTITNSGYGVFALKPFKKGDIIEECPYLPFSDQTPTELKNYLFNPSHNTDKLFLPLGHGCLYNHTELPNAAWNFDEEKQLITFQALKNIPKDNEIFIYYSPQWFSSRKTESNLPYKRTKKFLLILGRIGFISLLFGIFIIGLLPSQNYHPNHQRLVKESASTKKLTGIQ